MCLLDLFRTTHDFGELIKHLLAPHFTDVWLKTLSIAVSVPSHFDVRKARNDSEEL